MLPRTAQGETGPPPVSSAAETKPSLVRLGGLKHGPGKSGPENRVRLALNLTLRNLQKLRQGPGSSMPYALPYWNIGGLRASRRPRVKSIQTACAEEIGGVRKSRGCSVLYCHIGRSSSAEKNRKQFSSMNFPYSFSPHLC